MAYIIAEPCVDVMHLTCVAVCPVDCIQYEPGVDRMLYINPDECIDCGACLPECPTEAIFVDSELPAKWAAYAEINALWYSDREAARALVELIAPATASTETEAP